MSGFTLIEMAMVMVIAGIILSTIMTVLPSVLRTAKAKETRALLDKYDYALQGYVLANFRLPFADKNKDGIEDGNKNSDLGTNVYIGFLPYKTLGLSSGNDAWGHSIRYAVYGKAGLGKKNLTYAFVGIKDPAASPPSNPNYFRTALDAAAIGTHDPAIVYTIDAGGTCGIIGPNLNQAYVIASGGPKDLDGNGQFFDHCNGNLTSPCFDADNKTQTLSYDDLVRSKAATVLSGEIN